MAHADLVGAVLDGRYRVIEPIGQGAMGIVYRGERIRLGRAVAIKVLHDSLPHELAGRKRFELEARAMAQLEHPHCVAVLDVGLHEGRPYVVMDFVSGRNLRALLDTESRRLEIPRAVGIVKQVLSGLSHAHELGIVHRDIKPANLMLGQKAGLGDQVKILDFGLARSLDPDAKRRAGGMVLGTPSYMAPEQARDEKADARTDLYSVGILLFELLTGKKPFESPADDPVEVVGMHLHRTPPKLADVAPGIDFGDLEAVVARALAKAPDDRYPTAAALSAAIDAAVVHNEMTKPFELNTPPFGAELAAHDSPPVARVTPPSETLVAAQAAVAAEEAPAEAAEPRRTSDPALAPAPAAPAEPARSDEVAAAPRPITPVAGTPVIPAHERTDPVPSPEMTIRVAPLAPPRPPPSPAAAVSLAYDPPEVQQRRLHIAAGVIGATVVVCVLIRACAGGGGDATSLAGRHDAAVVASAALDAGGVQMQVTTMDAEAAIARPADAGALTAADAADTAAPDAGVAPSDTDDPVGAAIWRANDRAGHSDVDGALKILAAARRKFPANPDIPLLTGKLQIGKQRYAEGATSIRAAMRLFPGYIDDPPTAEFVVRAFMSSPTRNADLAKLLREDLRHAALPLLRDARDHAATSGERERAVFELNDLR